MTTTYTTVNTTKAPKITKDMGLAAATILACHAAQVGIIALNIGPYTNLVTATFAKGFGVDLPVFVSGPVGLVLLVGIQAAELRPLFLNRPKPEQERDISRNARDAFVIDAVLACINWPPISVSVARFVALPTLSAISIPNIIMIVAITYGVVALQKVINRTKTSVTLPPKP